VRCEISFDLATAHAADLPLATCPEILRDAFFSWYGQFPEPSATSVPAVGFDRAERTNMPRSRKRVYAKLFGCRRS